MQRWSLQSHSIFRLFNVEHHTVKKMHHSIDKCYGHKIINHNVPLTETQHKCFYNLVIICYFFPFWLRMPAGNAYSSKYSFDKSVMKRYPLFIYIERAYSTNHYHNCRMYQCCFWGIVFLWHLQKGAPAVWLSIHFSCDANVTSAETFSEELSW